MTENVPTNDINRRFAGTQKLYGDAAFSQFSYAHVVVVGIGGVGSWVVEGLARTGVGRMTLIDMDVLVASNVNRQLPAMNSHFGKGKAQVMAQRVAEINPSCQVTVVDEFLTPDNVASLLADKPNIVLDCIDEVKAKIALALHCRFNKLPLIMAGGAGGKIDPTRIKVADLKRTEQDPLLAKVRQKLRHECNINKAMKENFGICCVYSDEPPIVDKSCQTGGLHCGGYGSAVAVTTCVGMVMVAQALKKLAAQPV